MKRDCCKSCRATESGATSKRTDGATGCSDESTMCSDWAEHLDCDDSKVRTPKGKRLLKEVCCNSCEKGQDKPNHAPTVSE
jgi:hypothetical protein